MYMYRVGREIRAVELKSGGDGEELILQRDAGLQE